MKRLLILSGKGGTGKTTTAAAFIRFSQTKAIADCDVDAPNLHLVYSSTEGQSVSQISSPMYGTLKRTSRITASAKSPTPKYDFAAERYSSSAGRTSE